MSPIRCHSRHPPLGGTAERACAMPFGRKSVPRNTSRVRSNVAKVFEDAPSRAAGVSQRAQFLEFPPVLGSIGDPLRADDVAERRDQDAQTVDFELRRVLRLPQGSPAARRPRPPAVRHAPISRPWIVRASIAISGVSTEPSPIFSRARSSVSEAARSVRFAADHSGEMSASLVARAAP